MAKIWMPNMTRLADAPSESVCASASSSRAGVAVMPANSPERLTAKRERYSPPGPNRTPTLVPLFRNGGGGIVKMMKPKVRPRARKQSSMSSLRRRTK